MRRRALTMLVLTYVLALSWPVFADQIIPPDLVKWSQMPRMDRWGYDFSSETVVPSMVASDFQCTDPRPVNQIHWWGSYWQSGTGYPTYYSSSWGDPTLAGGVAVDPGIISGFNIEFYSDIPDSADPAVPMPWSHPGALLYEDFIPIADVDVTPYGAIDRNGDGIVGNDGDEEVWQYYAVLPQVFPQVENEIYWLKIQAVTAAGQPLQWGWHEADNLWNDESVQQGPSNLWGLLYDKEWVEVPNKDMAFELGVVPEPATWFLLGTGALVSIGWLRRKRI